MAIPVGITSFPSYGSCLPLDVYTQSSNKISYRTRESIDRKLMPTPIHLSRAIYIPYHNSNSTHLPLYNVSRAYESSIGDAPVGGSEFKTRLCLMRKPSHNAVDADVRFLVNVEHCSGRATVEERRLGDGAETSMILPNDYDEDFPLETTSSAHQYSVSATYPLPDTQTKQNTIRYPYFSLTSPDEKHSLEWQVHPTTLGKLGYILVDTTFGTDDPPVLAIYHHAGIEPEMPSRYTEGVLLLPEKSKDVDDTVIVASLFSLLWKIRAMGSGSVRKSRMTRFGEAFQKYAQGMTKLQTM